MTKAANQAFVGKVKRLLEEGYTFNEIMLETKKSAVMVSRAMRVIEIAKKRENLVNERKKMNMEKE